MLLAVPGYKALLEDLERNDEGSITRAPQDLTTHSPPDEKHSRKPFHQGEGNSKGRNAGNQSVEQGSRAQDAKERDAEHPNGETEENSAKRQHGTHRQNEIADDTA